MSPEINSIARIVIKPCGACRYLRKKCLDNCIFTPYFDSDKGTANFASIHNIFGASNVTKLLTNIPIDKRPGAVRTLNYEAHDRLQDPIYGCVSQIFGLQNHVINLQREIVCLQAQVARQPPPQQQPQSSLSMSDFLISRIHGQPFSSSSMIGTHSPELRWAAVMGKSLLGVTDE
ncbi:LOB domain-containing protein 18-like [Impatiens glandulifera]|uniref:LOB domain-containing protein 18-like n=1 Tax=Impatiens glandulifera TaxID=253017 RepID=UPI001FB04BB6|nr:LOB domain-containing protein 18-like [Impatiens glandulifera]